jgi:hypothetical protein
MIVLNLIETILELKFSLGFAQSISLQIRKCYLCPLHRKHKKGKRVLQMKILLKILLIFIDRSQAVSFSREKKQYDFFLNVKGQPE